MKAVLDIVYMTIQKPKRGYLLFVDHELNKVEELLPDGNLKLSNMYIEDSMVKNISEVQEKFVKFIVRTPKLILPIIHTDYKKLVTSLNNIISNMDAYDNADELIEDIINKNVEVSIDGEISKIPCKVLDDDKVEIVSLNIVDKYTLYDKTKRIFKVISILNKGVNTQYVLKSTIDDLVIQANRESFSIVGKHNFKDLFSIT